MVRPVRTLFLAALMLLAAAPLPAHAAEAPAAPVDLVVTPGDGRLVLTWSAPPGAAPSFYRVYREGSPDVLLATLVPSQMRFVNSGLADGFTRAYRIAAVHDGVEASTDFVSGTTFPRITYFSDFASGSDGFLTEQSGSSTVAWSSAAQAIRITQPVGSSPSILTRSLPMTWTDDGASFSVEVRVNQIQHGHPARLWPLALTGAGSGDIQSRANVLGIMVDENVDNGDAGWGVRFWYRNADGTLRIDDHRELCYNCGVPSHTFGVSYDARERLVSWSIDGVVARTFIVGHRAADTFNFTKISIASQDAPTFRTATHNVDDLLMTWKQAEAQPTLPVNVTAARVAHTHVALSWSPPLRAGAEPVTHYRILRDGVLIGTTSALAFTDAASGRWARHEYRILAVSEMGPSQPGRDTVAVMHKSFSEVVPQWGWIPSSWTVNARAAGHSISNANIHGALGVSFDGSSSHRRAVVLPDQPWTDSSGSFYAESVWNESGQGLRTGACLLTIIQAAGGSLQPCSGPNRIVGEFRSYTRTSTLGGNTAVGMLRYIDAGGVERINVSHVVEPHTTYVFNATYDLASRTMALRMLDASGTVLTSGSYVITGAGDGFSVGHVGVIAGVPGYTSGTTSAGLAQVREMRYGFHAPQPSGVPDAPTGLILEATGAREVTLSWNESEGAGEYFVYRTPHTLIGTSTATSFVDAQAPVGSLVGYWASAVGDAGEGLSTSQQVRTWGLPAAPPKPSAVMGPGRGEITVGWSAPAPDAGGAPLLGYHLFRAGSLVATLPATQTSIVDSGLADGTAYGYQLRGYNDVGAGALSSTGFAWTAALPGAPFLQVPTPGPGGGEMRLAWTSSASLRIESVVHRGLDGGPLVPIATVEGLAFNDTELPLGASAAYAVQVRNVVGTGPLSTVREASVPDVPQAPPNLTAQRGPGATQVTLKWNASSGDGLPVTGYVVYRDGLEVAVTTSLTHLATGLTAGESHVWEVAARSAAGEGARALVHAAAPTVPAAPRLPTATPGPGLGGIRLAWQAPLDNGGIPLTSYRLYRVEDGVPHLVATLAGDTAFNDKGLADDATYNYEIAAVNQVGEGPRVSVEGHTWARVAPGEVRELNARHAGIGLVRVTWQAPLPNEGQPAQRYLVYRIGGIQGETLAATVEATTWLDTSSTWTSQPALAYEYRVVAQNEAGEGPNAWSGIASPFLA